MYGWVFNSFCPDLVVGVSAVETKDVIYRIEYI